MTYLIPRTIKTLGFAVALCFFGVPGAPANAAAPCQAYASCIGCPDCDPGVAGVGCYGDDECLAIADFVMCDGFVVQCPEADPE